VAVSGDIADTPSFLAALAAERESFKEFHEILQTEQAALAQGQVDRLIGIAQLKTSKILQLSELAERRNRFLANHGLPPDQTGIVSWSEKMPSGNGRSALAVWAEILEAARAAQKLNLANGAMIEAKLQHNQAALAILQSATNQASTYGPDGKPHASGSGRPLGQV
jgi:flagella synthesis protein FlgN